MGLDMSLYRRTRVMNYDHTPEDKKYSVTVTKGGKPADVKPERISSIIEEAMYWRKANAIHGWFVRNVQDGEDDCGEYYVSEDNLKELLALCKAVAADHAKAEALLPTQSGFFFGGTEYDEGYFQDIDDTIKGIEGLLKENNEDSYFLYSSSW